MASADAYAACPCGSGEKFKWCCQKAESHAERALRLFQTGQLDLAIEALDEGLRKFPGNPWLALRKAVMLIQKGKDEQAGPVLEAVLAHHPNHLGAHSLLVQVLAATKGPMAATAQLQKTLTACPPEKRRSLGSLAQAVGLQLQEIGETLAALAHLRLAVRLLGAAHEQAALAINGLRTLEAHTEVSAWVKNPETLTPAPDSLDKAARDRFENALALAEGGLWADAARAFETLAKGGVIEAQRNLGLCRFWLADTAAGVAAIRRWIAKTGECVESVDLEALCQLEAPLQDADLVEHVQLSWRIRDRDRLIRALKDSPHVVFLGRTRLEPHDPKSPEVDLFELLDRGQPEDQTFPADLRNLPRILARIIVETDEVAVDTHDDGRLDDVTSQFTSLVGPAIPPAHPKTTELAKVSREALALQTNCWLPPSPDPADVARFRQYEYARLIREVWPATPMAYLGGRTPKQAAKAGDSGVALRAAVCRFEIDEPSPRGAFDFGALRASLGIAEEPPIDAQTVAIDRLHLARLHRVPADRLDDDRLVVLYKRARDASLVVALENAARVLLERPELLDREDVGRVPVYGYLANVALGRRDVAEAFRWLERGRQSDPKSRSANAVHWDIAVLRLQARSEPPERWVPRLAVLIDRYQQVPAAGPVLFSSLIAMGLVRASPNPDKPGEILVDTGPLQAVLAQYGPKITTAAGQMASSAAEAGLWTPGAAAGGAASPGGIWTPGSADAAGSADKPKLILPGR